MILVPGQVITCSGAFLLGKKKIKRKIIMSNVKFLSGENIPLEMHKVRMVQKINLLPIEARLQAMEEAGFNAFLLQNRDVFLDMLTDRPPFFVEALCNELISKGVPVVTPPGGLGAHVDATQFCSHIPPGEYRAGALAAAFYIASGVRGMERGTLSEKRNYDGSERIAEMELLRLAIPKRVFKVSDKLSRTQATHNKL